MNIYSKSDKNCKCGRNSHTYNTSLGVKCFRCIMDINYMNATNTKNFIQLSIQENERLMNDEIDLYIEPYVLECNDMVKEAEIMGVPPYTIRGYLSNIDYMINKRNEIQKKYLCN